MAPQTQGAIHSSTLEKSVLRSRQPKILPKGDTLILTSKNSSCLQFGHALLDEIVEAARKVGEHYVKAVRPLLHEPLLHLVRDHRGSTDHFKSRITADPLRELADRELVARGPFNHALTATFARVGFRDLGQRTVGIEDGYVVAKQDGKRADTAVVMPSPYAVWVFAHCYPKCYPARENP